MWAVGFVYPPLFATITYHMWSILYQAAYDWSMFKKGGVEFATFSSKEKGLALINSKHENVDQIQADNMIKRSGVRINRKI
jgi:hypothetical protein